MAALPMTLVDKLFVKNCTNVFQSNAWTNAISLALCVTELQIYIAIIYSSMIRLLPQCASSGLNKQKQTLKQKIQQPTGMKIYFHINTLLIKKTGFLYLFNGVIAQL